MAFPPPPPDWLDPTLDRVTRARVAVFGDFALDAYWELDRDESERSVETGKPVRKVRAQRYGPGAAGNVVANLAALRVAAVRAIGLVGADPFGERLVADLQRCGADTSGLLRDQADWQTPVFAKPHRGGVEQNRLDFGAFNELDQPAFDRLQALLEQAAAECDVVILNQQIPVGLSPSPVIAWLNRLIAAHPTGRFLVDSRHRPHEYDRAVLKINEAEARAMQEDGASPVEELALALCERVEAPVFITRGAAGIVACEPGTTDRGGAAARVHRVPGIPLPPPLDPVGAGDTAVAAVAAALAGGATVQAAARLANCAAAVTATKCGTTGTASPDAVRAMAARSVAARSEEP